MFGVSLPELLVIFGVALIVFGPEKLPELARTLGKLSGQAKRSADQLRREFYNNLYPPIGEDQLGMSNAARELRALRTEVENDMRNLSSHQHDDSHHRSEDPTKHEQPADTAAKTEAAGPDHSQEPGKQ